MQLLDRLAVRVLVESVLGVLKIKLANWLVEGGLHVVDREFGDALDFRQLQAFQIGFGKYALSLAELVLNGLKLVNYLLATALGLFYIKRIFIDFTTIIF